MSAVKRIKYCDALDFLENHLPKEFTFSEAKVSTGGRRILIYWKDEIQPMQDGKLRFFSEFGREYLGVSNTNEPHIEYIRKHLEKMYNALLKTQGCWKNYRNFFYRRCRFIQYKLERKGKAEPVAAVFLSLRISVLLFLC